VNQATIAAVAEGHGEVAALPILLRRIAAEIAPDLYLEIPPPFRTGRQALVRPGGLERVVQVQGDRVAARGGVLVVLDADDDCPAALGPHLLERIRATRPDRRTAVVLAVREYEGWFLASAESLAKQRDFPADLKAPIDPESVRGAKEWLTKRRPGRPYKETADQAALTQRLNVRIARERSPSFDKLWREVERLLAE
jgi:hypothetical protein